MYGYVDKCLSWIEDSCSVPDLFNAKHVDFPRGDLPKKYPDDNIVSFCRSLSQQTNKINRQFTGILSSRLMISFNCDILLLVIVQLAKIEICTQADESWKNNSTLSRENQKCLSHAVFFHFPFLKCLLFSKLMANGTAVVTKLCGSAWKQLCFVYRGLDIWLYHC